MKDIKKDPMRGFKFVTFDWGTNVHKCPLCDYVVTSHDPLDFAKKADRHLKQEHDVTR